LRERPEAASTIETPITVVVVDDHQVFVDALTMLLEGERDLDLVGSAGEGAAGSELCETRRPDVALVDIALPDVDGVTVIREIVRRSPRTNVVVIAALADDDVVVEAINAGAVGFVPKVRTVDELLSVVRQAAKGNVVLPAERHDDILRRVAVGQGRRDIDLTRRERDVLRAFGQGMTADGVARRLGVGVAEVESSVAAILSQLDARSVLEAVLIGLRRGLVTLDARS
jgi:DNA-binding NarL/FixJ family response regulator